MTSETILQGTDGIRGLVSRNIPKTEHRNALTCFLDSGIMTPAFFELYTYSYASLLLMSGCAERGDPIITGWDPRDSSGEFNQAALSGIRKAGLNTVTVGILPTPAIPLYMLKTGASGGVMLTASHNPADQNGIKLFHGTTALKFLPPDDAALSSLIFRLQDRDLTELPEIGNLADHSDVARSFFISFQTDPRNSWVNNVTFEDQILVIDAAKGAVATVVQEIFNGYDFRDVVYTNLTGNINESCGVADLEGHHVIDWDDMVQEDGRFIGYETLETMATLAATESGIGSGDTMLSGLVFDGDGDRCFRLDYDPIEKTVIVSSGDHLGIQMARHLNLKKANSSEPPLFVNTVESDLKTAITAEDEGYQPVITGVGDKWILKRAVIDFIRSQVSTESEYATEIMKQLSEDTAGKDLSGLAVSRSWKQYLAAAGHKTPAAVPRFQIGIEESGHSITPGFFDSDDHRIRCFAGNGIKTGLNALVAIQKLQKDKTLAERIQHLKYPFEPGVKKTYYTYYVHKNRLMPGETFREQLISVIQENVKYTLPETIDATLTKFSEEPALVYFRLSENDRIVGALFVRNSGTEDKSALYLRGDRKLEDSLEPLGMNLHRFMLNGMKNRESEFAVLERQILSTVGHGLSLADLRANNTTPSFDRVLREIEFKEGLLQRQGAQWILTEKGKLLHHDWERQDKSNSEENK